MTAQEVLELFTRVLGYYSGKAKVSTLKDDEGSPMVGKELMDADIQKLDERIEAAKNELASARSDLDFREAIRDNQPLLKDAFTVYLDDLRKSKAEFLRKIGGSTLKTENLDGELRLVEEYLRLVSSGGF